MTGHFPFVELQPTTQEQWQKYFKDVEELVNLWCRPSLLMLLVCNGDVKADSSVARITSLPSVSVINLLCTHQKTSIQLSPPWPFVPSVLHTLFAWHRNTTETSKANLKFRKITNWSHAVCSGDCTTMKLRHWVPLVPSRFQLTLLIPSPVFCFFYLIQSCGTYYIVGQKSI